MSQSGSGQDPRRGEFTPAERAAFERRAAELGQRLDEVKARKAPAKRDGSARGRALSEAFKIVAELVAGVAVGGGIGWFLDNQLGTRPWMLVVFLVLGFAAGLSNVIRTARSMQARSEPLQRQAKPMRDDDEAER